MNSKSETAPRSRPRFLRLLSRVVALAALVVVLLCVAIGAVVVGDPARVRDPLGAWLSGIVGRELRIEGAMEVQPGPVLRVRLEGLTLADAPWGTSEPMLRVDALDIAVRVDSLFSGPLHFESLRLEGVALRLTRSAGGAGNWQLRPAGEDELAVRAPMDALPVLVDRLDMTDLTAVLQSPAFAEPLQIRIDDSGLVADGEQLRARTRGVVGGEPLRLDGRIAWTRQPSAPRAVEFAIDGVLGDVELDGSGTLDDLFAPRRPAGELHLRGPSIEYLLDVLAYPPISRGPLDAKLTVELAKDRVELSLDGVFGEFHVATSGWVSELATASNLSLDLSVAGPNLAHIGELLNIEHLPAAAFSGSGHLVRSAAGMHLEGIAAQIGDASFSVDGHLRDFPAPSGAEVNLKIRGPDIGTFRELLRIPGVLSGPFAYDVAVRATDAGGQRISLDGEAAGISQEIKVVTGPAPDYRDSRIEFAIRGPDLRVPAAGAGITTLPALPFEAKGTAILLGDRVRLEGGRVQVGEVRASLSGDIDPDYPGTLTRIDFDVAMPDLAADLAPFGLRGVPAAPFAVQGAARISTEGLHLEQLAASIDAARVGGGLVIALDSAAPAVDFDLTLAGGRLADLLPSSELFRPSVEPVSGTLRGRFAPDRLAFDELSLAVGDASLNIEGVIDGPPSLADTRLRVQSEGASLARLGTSDRFRLPDLPFSLAGAFTGTERRITASDLSLVVGDSAASMAFAYEDRAVPYMELRLRADRLDLRPFVAAGDGAVVAASPGGRVIPDIALPVELLRLVDFDTDLDVGHLQMPDFDLDDLRFVATLRDGALQVSDLAMRNGRGSVQGSLSYGVAGADALIVALDGENIRFAVPGEAPAVTAARPGAALAAKLTARGADLRSLVASLDGRAELVFGSGQFPAGDSLFVTFFLGDLSLELLRAVNPFSERSGGYRLLCGVVLVDVADGDMTGEPVMVMRTDKLDIVASGKVDLASEQLNLQFSTQLRQGLGLSVSDLVNPFTLVSGTLASPTLGFDQKGALVEGSAAVATAGLSVLVKSIRGRFFAAEDPCGSALADFRRAHKD